MMSGIDLRALFYHGRRRGVLEKTTSYLGRDDQGEGCGWTPLSEGVIHLCGLSQQRAGSRSSILGRSVERITPSLTPYVCVLSPARSEASPKTHVAQGGKPLKAENHWEAPTGKCPENLEQHE